jgi:hypothetical protein
MMRAVKGIEAFKRSGPCPTCLRRLVWWRWIALAFVGMLAASSLAVVLGVGEARAQGIRNVSSGNLQPAAQVANNPVTPDGIGSAPGPAGTPSTGTVQATEVGQAAPQQVPVSDSVTSPNRSSSRDPHDETEPNDLYPTANGAQSRQLDATPPATESVADPSGRVDNPPPAPLHESASTRAHEEESTQDADSKDRQDLQGSFAERPTIDGKPSRENKPSKDEEPASDEKSPKEEEDKAAKDEKPANQNSPSKNEESKPSNDNKTSSNHKQPSKEERPADENKPPKGERSYNENRPSKDEKLSNEHPPPKDVELVRDENPPKAENKPPKDEHKLPKEERPPNENKLSEGEKPPKDEKPAAGPKAGEPTPAEKSPNPEPDTADSAHAERPAPSQKPISDPPPDAASDSGSEAPADPKSDAHSNAPSTSSKPVASEPVTEFESDAATRASTPERNDGPVQHSVALARKPESEARTRVEPRGTPVVAERAPEYAPGTSSVPTVEPFSDPAVTDLAKGPAVAESRHSAAEQLATGTSRLIGEVFGASTGLLANSVGWVGDLVSDLRGATDWLLGNGANAFNPPGDPLSPLGRHRPVGPAPPVPVPVGSSAPGGLSFSQSSSFGHASKHPFKEFGTLEGPPDTLMQGSKAAWPRYEPLYPGSAAQYILERPG